MRSLSLCILYLLLSSAVPAAAEPAIQNLSAVASGGKVSVSFQLTGAFTSDEVVAGLQSGVPTSFTYIVEIFRDRPNWFDDGLDDARIEVIATFNSVTREYLLNYRRDRKLVRSESFSDLAALEQRMTTVNEPGLFDIGRRRPYKLKVRVKADLTRGWRMWIIPYTASTPWRERRVTVQEAPPRAPEGQRR